MSPSRLIARPMLASIFVIGGFNEIRNAGKLAPAAEPVLDRAVPLLQKLVPQLPTDPVTLVRINGAVELLGGLALATGRAPRLGGGGGGGAAALALTLVSTTAAGHRFWEESDPQARSAQRIHFFKNVSMMGGLLIASGDTAGKPGVAWRTGRVAKDARREAKHLAHAARREAALAKAKVT